MTNSYDVAHRYKVRGLLKYGVHSDRLAMEFRNASFGGHYKTVKLLLQDPRVDPSADNNRSVKEAVQQGHYKIVKEILLHTRFVGFNLHLGCWTNCPKIEKLIEEHEAKEVIKEGNIVEEIKNLKVIIVEHKYIIAKLESIIKNHFPDDYDDSSDSSDSSCSSDY
jgi:hypothetical protein